MESLPITCRFANPWIEDNSDFTKSLRDIGREVKDVKELLRERMIEDESILSCGPGNISPIGAVDASVQVVDVGDFTTVLVQAGRHVDGVTTFDNAYRFGPTDSETARSFAAGARIARECVMLSDVESCTIADGSFFSFLMEANQALTSWANNDDEAFKDIPETIVTHFEAMVRNKHVVAMPKKCVAQSVSKDYNDIISTPVSNSYLLSQILKPGEYTQPMQLNKLGNFGIERRGDTGGDSWDHEAIKKIYVGELFYTYFKPWAYKRAYRIEGRMDQFTDDLFASVKEATKFRQIAEPLPQFMVDHAVGQLGGVAALYGEQNRFRFPFAGFHRT